MRRRVRSSPSTGPRRSAQADQVDDEHKGLVGADDPAGAALAVAEHRRDRDPAPTADLHPRHALVPPGDDLPLAEPELERGAAIPGRVELPARAPRDADVVDLRDATLHGLLAAADDDVLELELVGRRLAGRDL